VKAPWMDDFEQVGIHTDDKIAQVARWQLAVKSKSIYI